MSIQSRYVHTLVIHRNAQTMSGSDPVFDDYGQPVMVSDDVFTVPGLVQPRSVRELAQANQAGVAVGEFVGYLDPLAITTRDWLVVGGQRYDIVGIRDAAGLGHHYELDLKRVDA